jgi:hypothetical protein
MARMHPNDIYAAEEASYISSRLMVRSSDDSDSAESSEDDDDDDDDESVDVELS